MAAAAAATPPPIPEIQINTTMGSFTVELYPRHAPKTCHNFVELSKRGYYDNVIFHRIIPDFMVQGGDPTGTGRGGESIFGGKFADEISRELKHTGAGILSMANAGPNTNGSQFFLTTARTPHLDGRHVVFGRVVRGEEVVKAIEAVGSSSGRTAEPVVIAASGEVEFVKDKDS